MKPANSILSILLALVLGAVGVLTFLYIDDWISVSSVRFVVPDGYRGMFCIREHPDGIDNIHSDDGRIVYEIPPKGFLDVRDASHFRLTKSNIVVTRSGRVFPELPWPAAPPFDDRIGFSILSVSSDGWYWFLIGTERELYEYFNGHEEVVGGVKDQCVQEDKAGVIP